MREKHDILLFDLDGTISDPLEGIAKSINYSLSHFGFANRDFNELAGFVGPPIDHTFKLLTEESSGEAIASMVEKYRERFSEVGYSENVLYLGMYDVLFSLRDSGMRMAICTSKRQDYAIKIVEMFELSDCFEFIDGGDVGISKAQQIESLLKDSKVSHDSLMIGDRAVDLISAHKNGLETAGVLWGYGSREELEKEKPEYLFESPKDLLTIKDQLAS